MKRLIYSTSQPKVNQARYELESYTSPSTKGYTHDVLLDLDSMDSEHINRELLITEICDDAAERICQVTGIYPYVVHGYTFLLPAIGVSKYFNEWVEEIDSTPVAALPRIISQHWVSEYRKVLKAWYKRDFNIHLYPREYADSVLGKNKGVLLPYAVIDNRDTAKNFIVDTVSLTYKRNNHSFSN